MEKLEACQSGVKLDGGFKEREFFNDCGHIGLILLHPGDQHHSLPARKFSKIFSVL
jgi:hypothetical protein